jgi:hypothetical protein
MATFLLLLREENFLTRALASQHGFLGKGAPLDINAHTYRKCPSFKDTLARLTFFFNVVGDKAASLFQMIIIIKAGRSTKLPEQCR